MELSSILCFALLSTFTVVNASPVLSDLSSESLNLHKEAITNTSMTTSVGDIQGPSTSQVVISVEALGPRIPARTILRVLLKMLWTLVPFSQTAIAPPTSVREDDIYVDAGSNDNRRMTVADFAEAILQIGVWMDKTLWYGACDIAIRDRSRTQQIGYARIARVPFLSRDYHSSSVETPPASRRSSRNVQSIGSFQVEIRRRNVPMRPESIMLVLIQSMYFLDHIGPSFGLSGLTQSFSGVHLAVYPQGSNRLGTLTLRTALFLLADFMTEVDYWASMEFLVHATGTVVAVGALTSLPPPTFQGVVMNMTSNSVAA